MGVAVEGALWVSVRALIAGQVPDDQSLISATRQEHVWAIQNVSIDSFEETSLPVLRLLLH